VIGRYFSLDRDNRWDRVRSAYELIAKGKGKFLAQSAIEAIEMAYERGETDEFVQSSVIKSPTKINKGDVMIFMNYRADRARQITQAFTDENFQGFSRGSFVPTQFICLTEYKKDFNLPMAYPPAKLNNVLGKYLSNLGMTQLRIAETEKYAHVTFFLNGGIERPFYGEGQTHPFPPAHKPFQSLQLHFALKTCPYLWQLIHRQPTQFICLTEYKKDFNLPMAYPPAKLNNVLGKYLSNYLMTLDWTNSSVSPRS
jgi:bisphosphoglycerate-independent phosphoglycerate mutase (AlkP superfamily)